MKILFVASLYYPHVGGIETVIKELSQRYLVMGNEVCVLTKRYPNDLEEYSCVDGVDVYRIKSARTLEEFEEAAKFLKRIESRVRADCVHVVGLRRPLGLFALMLARKWGVPLIVSAGGGELPEPGDESSKLIWKESENIAKEAVLQADRNVTFSEDIKKLLHENVSQDIRVDIVHAGVDLDAVHAVVPVRYNHPFIFSCRRLVWSKGIDITLHAFSRIFRDFPDTHLVIAGEGDEYENLVQIVNRYELADRVKFLGTLSWEESIGWLKSALFTVVPSRAEGGGLINIEAQAAGCPVIGSRAAGIAEYTQEDTTSLLFEVGDVDACASHMRRLLSDNKLRALFGENGKAYAKGFSWDTIVDEYFSVYRNDIDFLEKNKKGVRLWSEESRTVWNIVNSNKKKL